LLAFIWDGRIGGVVCWFIWRQNYYQPGGIKTGGIILSWPGGIILSW
jgi:hypothetical protein